MRKPATRPRKTSDSFDKKSFEQQFEKALPKIITEMSDLLEKPVPRVSKRQKKEISEKLSSGIDVSIPHLKTLEEMSGDFNRIAEGYQILEKVIRTQLRQADIRLRPNEDAFDYMVRQSSSLVRSPSILKRQKQFRVVREGVELLIRASVSANGGMKQTQNLIEEFGRNHLKEYMRFANTIDARRSSYRNIDLRRVTARNIARISDIYRDTAAAFETRLKMLVGLNFIAQGNRKTYGELRGHGYNKLLQAVESPKNPLLHFLKGAVNRHVRNALMHNGVSSSLSKRLVRFVDYAPHSQKETVIEWNMNRFLRETKKLLMTVRAAAYLEQVFAYYYLYCTVAAFRYVRDDPSVLLTQGNSTTSSSNRVSARTKNS